MNLIVESANGDIRSAIMALQFACTLGGNSATKRRKGRDLDAATILESVTRREQSLVLFHLLGKLLYNKRMSLAAWSAVGFGELTRWT